MIIIGEKINGSIPSVAEAIANRDAEFIKQRALAQANSGASYIDCCASVPEAEEVETLKWMIDLVQEVTDTPICVDSPSAKSCVAAIPFCKRPGLVNSVSLEGNKIDTIFPVIADTDWECVALLCDNDGIPDSVERRMKVFHGIMEKAKEYNIPIRVGVNSGSLEKELVKKYHGVTAEGIVESALDKVHMIEEEGYENMVISIKSSDVLMCVRAHEILSQKTDYPLHVGITEAGTIISGNIKSSIGLGLILHQGIGDTIRVSLTGDPVEEIKSAKIILRTLGLRKGGIEVVSCPTCGRTKIDLIGLANQVETMVAEFPLNIKVAVMGCAVNGPGEAKEADLGIAGGINEGLLIKKGEIIRKVPEDQLLSVLREELEHWES